MTHEIVIADHVDAGREKFYRSVPFEIPPGVSRIDVSYRYNERIHSDPRLTGGNTVDIGLFDWRGDAFLDAGFRGWTGSQRLNFFVGARDATPGYLMGPLTPGTWYVSLGFYKIGPRGCDYEVRVAFTFGDDQTDNFPPMLRLDSPNATLSTNADGWYRGELHCHTVHSDGDSTAQEVVRAAEALGLDFLAIMDHNNITHLVELRALGPQNLILIPGYEVTTYKGHWNLWAPPEWIDFRVQSPADMQAAIRRAVAAGGLTSVNHPRSYGPPWEYGEISGYHCVEVWNGPWRLANNESLAFWETRLRAGKRLVAVGGSDMHRLKMESHARPATPTTWIYCPDEPTAAGLLAGLRAGHVFLSERPEGPRLVLSSGKAMMGDTVAYPASGQLDVQVRVERGAGSALEMHTASGRVQTILVRGEAAPFNLRIPVTGTNYVRAQLVDPTQTEVTVRALTNPIYVDGPAWLPRKSSD